MKSIFLNLLLVSFLMFSCILFSQEKKSNQRLSQTSPNGIHRCLSDEYNTELLKRNPEMMGSESFEKKLQNIIKARKSSKVQSISGATLVRIPVVVHVIHNGTSVGVDENISDAQVLSQIQVLNEDFRKMAGTRGDNSNLVGADTNIEFYLAKVDPDCNPTSGIDRLNFSSISTSWSGPGGNTDAILKPMTIWDPSQYMNMWTVAFSDNTLLGYAQYPGNGPSETDGVVMGYQYFGSDDAPGVTIPGDYNLGRTTTHEVGHFLGLFHTFEGGCMGSGDQVADTPAVKEANFGCPIGTDSCPADPGDDMIENYMDYTDDVCMNVFTNGQSLRMDGVLSDFRLSLANSTVPESPLPSVSYDGSIKILNLKLDPCTSSFSPEIRLSNFGTVTLSEATITYNLNSGTSKIFNWTGVLLNGESEIINLPNLSILSDRNTFNVAVSLSNTDQRTCNDEDSEFFKSASYESATQVHLKLITDDWAEETSWEFKDSNNTILYSDSYNPSDNNKTFDYSFDIVQNECYTFTINDDFGDGICCGENGDGSYELRTDDNTLIKSGGVFGAEESTVISTTTLSVDNYFITNDISLYPNPTSTDLTIKVRTINDLPTNIQVYNMLGQNLLSKRILTAEDLKIRTYNLSKGMYFIKISKDHASITLPFIKK